MPSSDAALPAVAPSTLPAELEAIRETYGRLREARHARSTRRAYAADWRAFVAFCEAHGAQALPAAPVTVAAFVAAEAAHRAPSTIGRRLAAIKHAHGEAGAADPCGDARVRDVLRGLRRSRSEEGHTAAQAAPVGRRALDRIIGAAQAENTPAGFRDAALLAVGYDMAARRSELVALDLADLEIQDDDTAVVAIRRSKTNQEGDRPDFALLAADTVRSLRRWLDAAKIQEGPIFRRLHRGQSIGGRLSDRSVALILARRAEAAGVDPAGISGHSLRVGVALDGKAAGLSDLEIADVGRWRSTATVRRYTARYDVKAGGAAKLFKAQGR